MLEPFDVDPSTWFYADATTITIVRVINPVGAARAAAAGASHTEEIKIPARLLRKALRLIASENR